MLATLQGFAENRSGDKPFMEYQLACGWRRGETKLLWAVARRYTEFAALHTAIAPFVDNVSREQRRPQLQLPRKGLFQPSTETRAAQLAAYLQHLQLNFPEVLELPAMIAFLDLHVQLARVGAAPVAAAPAVAEAPIAEAPAVAAAPVAAAPVVVAPVVATLESPASSPVAAVAVARPIATPPAYTAPLPELTSAGALRAFLKVLEAHVPTIETQRRGVAAATKFAFDARVPMDERRVRCRAMSACLPWLLSVLAAHGGDAPLVEQALSLVNSLAWGIEGSRTPVMAAVPAISAALRMHAGQPGVVRQGLGCLNTLSTSVETQGPLGAVVPLVVAVCAAQRHVVDITELGIGCLRNLASCGANQAGLLPLLPAIIAALVQHRGVGVTEQGLGCLRSLSGVPASQVPLMAALPVLSAALEAHPRVVSISFEALGFLSQLALSPANKAGLAPVLSIVPAVWEKHQGDPRLVLQGLALLKVAVDVLQLPMLPMVPLVGAALTAHFGVQVVVASTLTCLGVLSSLALGPLADADKHRLWSGLAPMIPTVGQALHAHIRSLEVVLPGTTFLFNASFTPGNAAALSGLAQVMEVVMRQYGRLLPLRVAQNVTGTLRNVSVHTGGSFDDANALVVCAKSLKAQMEYHPEDQCVVQNGLGFLAFLAKQEDMKPHLKSLKLAGVIAAAKARFPSDSVTMRFANGLPM